MRTIFLPFLIVFLASCSNEDTFHELEVVNGTGSGVYEFGKEVQIQANAPGQDEAFFEWAGDTQFIDAVKAPVARVRMPLQDVAVQAIYRNLPKYDLTVVNGSGSGSYLAETRVQIAADIPAEDFVFFRWVGDTAFLERTDTAVSFVTIPEESVSVEATYKDVVDLVSFSETIWPIFIAKCSYAGCHDRDDPETPLTNYNEIIGDLGSVKESIISGSMPKTGSLTASEKDAILLWIEQGAPNN